GPPGSRIEAERKLRMELQDEITNLPEADSKLRAKLFSMVEQAVHMVMNDKQDWKEFFDACQFALEQHTARPGLFNAALVILSSERNRRQAEACQLAEGVLKLIAERPEAFSERDRNQTGDMCRQYQARCAPQPAQT